MRLFELYEKKRPPSSMIIYDMMEVLTTGQPAATCSILNQKTVGQEASTLEVKRQFAGYIYMRI